MSRFSSPEAQELSELAALLAEGARLSRGRSYQRKGAVNELTVEPGMVSTSVAGSDFSPYRVTIACKEASENDRADIASDIAAAVPRPLDIGFSCRCPDWGDPCKHGVAALLAFASEVDDDPSLLLTWRGVDDVTPPPPPGTESLVGETAVDAAEPGTASPSSDSSTGRTATYSAVRSNWGREPDSGTGDGIPADSGAEEPAEPELEGVLLEFFQGAMTDDGDLVGPLEERQLDAYSGVRIVVENLDVAPVLAEALEAVADHWLNR